MSKTKEYKTVAPKDEEPSGAQPEQNAPETRSVQGSSTAPKRKKYTITASDTVFGAPSGQKDGAQQSLSGGSKTTGENSDAAPRAIRVQPTIRTKQAARIRRETDTRHYYAADGSRRLYLPVEADRLKRQAGFLTADGRKLRRAKRSLDLKPAPPPIEAPKTPLRRRLRGLFNEAKELLSRLDYVTILAVAALSIIGILAVHSATLTKSTDRFDIMQIGMTVVGFCLLVGLSYLDYDGLIKNYRLILIVNCAMLLFTAIFGTGADGGGDTNHNWIRIGSIGIQPAELGKILYIITFASHIEAVKHRLNHIKTVFGLLLHAGLILGLVLLEKDVGQVTVYAMITVCMLFGARLSLWYFAALFGMALAGAPIVWNLLQDYQRERILVGFQPELDPLYRGYQVIKSKTAIAAGGVFGQGYRQGLITQTELLPAKQTDMIFAVIGEEAGFIGAIAVILLFCILIARLLRNAYFADKFSGRMICVGVAGMLLYQVIENIGMCLGLLPVIGITLPFVSYGGSSVLGTYLAVGVAVSVYAKQDRLYFDGKLRT